MNIHEYQAKALLAEYGVPVPNGDLAFTPEQAAHSAQMRGGGASVVKAQIHAGGRGAAGGVAVCPSVDETRETAHRLLGQRLVTKQTDSAGKQIDRLWIEEATEIAQELYLSFVLDRGTEQVMIIASAQGGMEIEDLAEADPNLLIRVAIDPAVGLAAFQARALAFDLGLKGPQIGALVDLLQGCYRAYTERDAVLLEINPLVVRGDGSLVALDAKMSFDGNAMMRQPEIAALRDPGQEDPRERIAGDHGLAYVGLDGDIGCIINGAGLAMASMDMIQLAGGQPANFLDIGGGASPERVCRAFRTVLSDNAVQVVLVNIFAGINRCDWIAEGVLQAYRDIGIDIPVVVRLSGTNVDAGRKLIAESGLPILSATTLAEAAELAVAARPQAIAAE